MSDSAQPLSRRERRALEEAAAAAEGEVTQALPVAPESISVLSRRERRRLERLENPLEEWTREEEMIATGQMPAMTPEVIAEQERLAAVQQAQADAVAAYEQTAPEAVVEEAPVEEAPVEEAPLEQPVAEAPAAPVADDAVPNDIPAELRHLFPPGSLQARGLEHHEPAAPVNPDAVDEIRRLTQEAMAGISRATTDQTPIVDAGQDEQPVHLGEVFEPGPVEPQPVEPQPVEPQPVEPAVAVVPELPLDVEELWNAPTVDEPVLPAASADPVQPPVELVDVPFVEELPHATEPHAGEPAGGAPVWSTLVPTNAQGVPSTEGPLNAQGAGRVGLAPAGFAPVPTEAAPSMWDTHPLTNPGASPVRELPAEPAQRELPRPDLTQLLAPQVTDTSVGQVQPYVAPEPLTTTSTSLPRVAEPQAGGGARHFRWAHLAVIGAIAFVLGVLAWNIARSH